jgi:hypothetical protein
MDYLRRDLAFLPERILKVTYTFFDVIFQERCYAMALCRPPLGFPYFKRSSEVAKGEFAPHPPAATNGLDVELLSVGFRASGRTGRGGERQ